MNSRHRNQTQKLSRMEGENHNLKARLKLKKNDAEKEIEQIIKYSDEIFRIHQEELERAYKEIEDLYKEIGSLKDEIKNLILKMENLNIDLILIPIIQVCPHPVTLSNPNQQVCVRRLV